MKPSFGPKSRKHRATLHGDLILVLDAVMEESTEEEDFAIICGLRNKQDQELAYEAGASKVHYPESWHNGTFEEGGKWNPDISDAGDIVPYPIEWPDKKTDPPHEYARKMKRFYNLAERVLAKAVELGVELEWGGMFKWTFDGSHFQRKRHDMTAKQT